MSKAKLGLKDLNPDQTVALANVIKTAMTGNANFATPNPSLATVGTAITTLQTSIAAYNSQVAGTTTALTTRETSLQSLRGLLTQLAAYVDNITGGDRVKIESSGMPVRNDPAPIGAMPAVQELVLEPSEFEGTLHVSWAPVRGAGSYEIQSSLDPVTGTSWVLREVSNISSLLVGGFTSGAKMWLRVRAVGADNERGPWSDPAAKTVP